MEKKYDMEIGSFLRFSMENAKKHWLKFFGALLGILIISVVIIMIGFNIADFLGVLLVFLVPIIASFGLFANVIRLSSGKTFDFKAFLPEFSVFLNFFLGMIICGFAVILGLILLIIPGIVVGIMLSLVPFLIVDKKMNFVEAIKESMRLTKGHKMDIFIGFFISNLVISLLSIPVITLFFTIPMQIFLQAFPYAQLTGLAGVAEESSQTEQDKTVLETP